MSLSLPPGWTHETLKGYGLVVTAVVGGRTRGSVTICENLRNFELGIAPVRMRGLYAGRGWKQALHEDAIKALQAALA